MSYQAQLAARLSQFGTTEVEWNMIDDAGVMPTARMSRKWRTAKVSAADIAAARLELRTRATAEYQARQQEAATKAAFEVNFQPYIEGELAVLNAEIQARAERDRALAGSTIAKAVNVRLEVA